MRYDVTDTDDLPSTEIKKITLCGVRRSLKGYPIYLTLLKSSPEKGMPELMLEILSPDSTPFRNFALEDCINPEQMPRDLISLRSLGAIVLHRMDTVELLEVCLAKRSRLTIEAVEHEDYCEDDPDSPGPEEIRFTLQIGELFATEVTVPLNDISPAIVLAEDKK